MYVGIMKIQYYYFVHDIVRKSMSRKYYSYMFYEDVFICVICPFLCSIEESMYNENNQMSIFWLSSELVFST